jgi:hypothetical protein
MDDSGVNIAFDANDEAKFFEHGERLQQAITGAIRPWLDAVIESRLPDTAISAQLAETLDDITTAVDRSIVELINADVDEPLSGPLERIRREVEPLNDAFDRLGVPPPHRDAVDVRMRPADRFALGPMTFRDLGDEVHEAGITWGAAKAHLHLQRRRRPDAP